MEIRTVAVHLPSHLCVAVIWQPMVLPHFAHLFSCLQRVRGPARFFLCAESSATDCSSNEGRNGGADFADLDCPAGAFHGATRGDYPIRLECNFVVSRWSWPTQHVSTKVNQRGHARIL